MASGQQTWSEKAQTTAQQAYNYAADTVGTLTGTTQQKASDAKVAANDAVTNTDTGMTGMGTGASTGASQPTDYTSGTTAPSGTTTMGQPGEAANAAYQAQYAKDTTTGTGGGDYTPSAGAGVGAGAGAGAGGYTAPGAGTDVGTGMSNSTVGTTPSYGQSEPTTDSGAIQQNAQQNVEIADAKEGAAKDSAKANAKDAYATMRDGTGDSKEAAKGAAQNAKEDTKVAAMHKTDKATHKATGAIHGLGDKVKHAGEAIKEKLSKH